MELKAVIKELELKVISGEERMDQAVEGVYVSDLLSQVVAKGQPNYLWLTIHHHLNVIAVATLLDFVGVLMVEDTRPDVDAVLKAQQERVCLLSTPLTAFEAAGRLYQLLNL